MLLYQILDILHMVKCHARTISLKYHLQDEMKNLIFPDGLSHYVSDIQKYCYHILKEHAEKINGNNNP